MTLALPFLTEADPAVAGEGSLDPLGLASTAERLAERVTPGVTNRMSRVRFLTATTVAAKVSEALWDVVPADGRSTPYLAFEWHYVLAVARAGLPPKVTSSVPGIDKARASIRGNGRMDAGSYLKTPTVFGFVGVYKRLGRALRLVDDALLVAENGDRLLRVWEEEQDLSGFVDRSGGRGANVARDFERAVTEALVNGKTVRPMGSHLWHKLVSALRPDGAGVVERNFLRELLMDESQPIRTEFLRRVVRSTASTEPETIRELRSEASSELAELLDAIDAYEVVSALLTGAFDGVRRSSTLQGVRALSVGELARHELVRLASERLPQAVERAAERLERIGAHGWMEAVIDSFGVSRTPDELLDELLDHHARVQAGKPPGKRPWFEIDERGVWVRRDYVLADDPPHPEGRFVHPYRVTSVRQLFSELA